MCRGRPQQLGEAVEPARSRPQRLKTARGVQLWQQLARQNLGTIDLQVASKLQFLHSLLKRSADGVRRRGRCLRQKKQQERTGNNKNSI